MIKQYSRLSQAKSGSTVRHFIALCVCMCKSVETDLVNCPLCVLTHFCLINILQECRDMFSVAFHAGRKAGLQ